MPPREGTRPLNLLRVVIAEGTARDRNQVRRLLERELDVEIVGECHQGPAAVEVVQRLQPDVLFLNTQLPGLDGFGVVQCLRVDPRPAVVFMTSQACHAVRAFELRAADYLLQPFQPDRFAQAIQRARELVHGWRTGAKVETLVSRLSEFPIPRTSVERLAARVGDRFVFIRIRDVDWVQWSRNYAEVHAGTTVLRVRSTIHEFQRQFADWPFVRISRSVLVNADRVQEIRARTHGDATVVLLNGTQLPVTRSYRRPLVSFLEAI